MNMCYTIKNTLKRRVNKAVLPRELGLLKTSKNELLKQASE